MRCWLPHWLHVTAPAGLVFLLPYIILTLRQNIGLVPEYDIGTIRYAWAT